MTDKFLTKIAEALNAACFPGAKFDQVHLVVGDVKFDAEMTKRGRVLFLDSRFKIDADKKGNVEFDIGKAIGLVSAALPAKLKAVQGEKNLLHNTAALRQKLGDESKVSTVLRGGLTAYYYKSAYVAPSEDGFIVQMYAQDLEEVDDVLSR